MDNLIEENQNNEYISHIQNQIDLLEDKLFDTTPNNPIIKSFDDRKERKELYQIILRERKECKELEKVRQKQNEKLKQTQMKCKVLEEKNFILENRIKMLKKEKIEQLEKIIELQKEIEFLRNQKERKIQYKDDKLNQFFSQRRNNIKYV